MINPTTHAITRVPHPDHQCRPVGITAGPDGNIWFTEVSQLIPRQASLRSTRRPTPSPSTPSLHRLLADGITAGPDGNLWFTDDRHERDRRRHLATSNWW